MLHWIGESRKVLPCPHPAAGQMKLPDAQVVFAAWGVPWVNVCSVDFVAVVAAGIEQFVIFYAKGVVVDPLLRSRSGEPLYGPSY
jgi:hypothetical protein